MGLQARVAVARPVRTTFLYAVPDRLRQDAVPGVRCVVPFGRAPSAGFLLALEEGDRADLKSLHEILDPQPCLPPDLLALGLWLAGYYHSSPGEALLGMLPPNFRTDAAVIYRAVGEESAPAGSGEAKILELLRESGEIAAPAIPSRLHPALESLLREGTVLRQWKVRPRPPPKPEEWFRLTSDTPPAASLLRSPRLQEVLQILSEGPLRGRELTARGTCRGALTRAVRRGWVERREAPSSAVAPALLGFGIPEEELRLNEEQEEALRSLCEGLGLGYRSFLLHGVTGSGKTEVYLRTAAVARARGFGVLLIVPEIALTPQLLGKFAARFGADVAVLHSGLAPRERFLQWERVRRGEARIAIGARSAIFAPVERLGLLIVDEEHEPSFKQEEGLRYHAKHVALMRARTAGAIVLLGSATPDLETYASVLAGRHSRLLLSARATGAKPPEIRLVDVRQEEKRRHAAVLLSGPLRAGVSRALERGEQVLLFLNRRGFSPAVVCRSCGEAVRCRRCSIALTQHRGEGEPQLLCHYCASRRPMPQSCPHCAEACLMPSGAGTQRLMQLAKETWPEARILRFDRDANRAAVRTGARGGALGMFARGEADILIGTQMVAKGHHFPKLTTVGIVDADLSLNFPDFRAAERTYQVLTQVAGRAGREDLPGTVYLQTRNPHHPAVAAVTTGDYEPFARAELAIREEAGFPPFRRLALLRVSGRDRSEAEQAASAVATRARLLGRSASVDVLGPAPAPLEQLRGRFRFQVLLRAPGPEPASVQAILRHLLADPKPYAGQDLRLQADIDPVSLL
jgi:primosomal protein N' (replication factor Y) (superfamily II helicase)